MTATDTVNQFFGERAPALLSDGAAGAAVDGRLRIDVHGVGAVRSWTVDCTADPPTISETGAGSSDCAIAVAVDDLAAIVHDARTAQVLAWQGRLRMTGDQAVLRRVAGVLFGVGEGQDVGHAGYYASLNRLVTDPRLTFLNHGYDEEAGDDFGWLEPSLWPSRYSVKLVRRTLRAASLQGARVLDVGCGRGGPAAYMAEWLGARAVVGLDACPEAIELCRAIHRTAGLEFVHGYAQSLPFDDGAFDVVVNLESSHCYPDRSRFLAEVARVLAPEGSFCYADVLRPADLAAVQAQLAGVPELAVRSTDDITRQVALGIERNRTGLDAFLSGLTDPALRNEAIVGQLIHSINVQIHDDYAAGRLRYHVWHIEKAKP